LKLLTDNKNRTASNIRTIFQKAGGSLGTQGSASHNFNQLGIIKIDKKEISDERIFELAIELVQMNVNQIMIFMKFNVQ
jgi:transcriptional/translational regulatory protein YebC/TACO1